MHKFKKGDIVQLHPKKTYAGLSHNVDYRVETVDYGISKLVLISIHGTTIAAINSHYIVNKRQYLLDKMYEEILDEE